MAFNVLTAEFLHETNTFNVRKTQLREFSADRLLEGSEGVEQLRETNTGVAGCLDCAEKFGWNITHALTCRAGPSGLVTTEAFDRLAGLILHAAAKGSFDGVLMSLHGAMVTECCEDGEGELLRRLRSIIGMTIPVAITLDLHANVTRAMCDLAQIIVSYKTYPHIDMREAACHAGDILHRTMQGDITPHTLRAHRAMLVEANGGRTDIGPMINRIEMARAYEAETDVFAVSINAGFESSDIAEIGPTVLVTCQGDDAAHQQFAESIADDIWTHRADVLNTYCSVEQAVSLAIDFSYTGAPFIISDYADNPGGGGYGDSTNLLSAMLSLKVPNACFAPLVDAEAARYMHTLEEGDALNIDIGGKTDSTFGGGPLNVSGVVRHLSNGRCIGNGPMKRNEELNFGLSAVLEVDGMEILVVSEAVQIYDQQQFRAFGIDLDKKAVIALKSMQHFRADFEPLAAEIIVCDSGALCTPDYASLPYKNVPRPIYPLDADM